MNTHYTYFLIHAAAIAGPLLLSFDRKVHFYKKWKYLFPAMIIPALFFLVWDELFTRIGVWGFNENYITGLKIGSLPVEEVLFFITVPYCCVFVYECVRIYFPKLEQLKLNKNILIILVILFLASGLTHSDKYYTATTFLFNAGFLLLLLIFSKWFSNFNIALFLIAYAICLIPFFIVNGFLTAYPVVQYNDAENMGIRIFSFLPWPMHNIPVEDTFYGMLLILMNVALFEKLRAKNQ
ncbi:MAG: lycopene cyclase domain-containing protein [Lacibacter sp.]